ncbi:hypothetical protein DPSP01_014619 [Paraphaeosphaeria sporulosa]
MHWADVLDYAAARPDGGPRSFPLAAEGRFLRDFAYDPPTKAYEQLLSRQIAVLDPSQSSQTSDHSAGWLIPDEASPCKPILIAPSLLSALSLIRRILPSDTLPDDAWQSLVAAAQHLAADPDDLDEDPSSVPPSAQKPPKKRKLSQPSTSPVAKRVRLSGRASRRFSSPQTALSVSHAQPPAPSPLQLPAPPEPPSAVENSPSASPGQPDLVVKVTNNNRRADRDRRRKQTDREQHAKEVQLGLVRPPSNASKAETHAYEAITRGDEPDVAWILKQKIAKEEDKGEKRLDPAEDLMTTAASPYVTATSMLKHARSLGNTTVQRHASAFLSAWRSRGSPFPVSGKPAALSAGDADAMPATQVVARAPVSGASAVDEALLATDRLVDHYQYRVAAVHIEYRWAMASYGRAYADKIAELEAQGVPRKECNGRAIDTLIQMRTPGGKLDKSARGALRLRLSRATRWYHAARTLGWGFLCLMPSEIAPKWVEQTLRVGEWALWLEVVKKVNPDTYKASQVLDAWLGADGIAGKPISGKETLFVEADVPMPSTQVEEVADSEEEGEVGDDEDGDESDGETEPAPARSLRQLSLVDMFKPRE